MVTVQLEYRDDWRDNFGARGWKRRQAASRDIIACTAFIGGKSPTSVPVHDLLDHHVCGFSVSRYTDEAKATVLHGLRNGIEIRTSLVMLAEDLLGASKLSEPMEIFLPEEWVTALSPDLSHVDKRRHLQSCYSPQEILQRLTDGLHRVGMGGVSEAMQRWREQGLAFERMEAIGHALQRLLERAETEIAKVGAAETGAVVEIGNRECRLALGTADHPQLIEKIN